MQASNQHVAGVEIHESDGGKHAREVQSSLIVGGASVAPRREYQHFPGGFSQENGKIILSFSDMLLEKHWRLEHCRK